MTRLRSKTMSMLLAVVLAAGIQALTAPTASAVVTDDVPTQVHCDGGGGSSLTYTWASEAIARPQIASMTVDGQTIVDPANPNDGELGAVICPNVPDARKTGLTIVKRTGSSLHSDLTGAVLPNSDPVTSSSEIEITMTDLGDLAEFYSFSLVHGIVDEWTTANLGAANASLTFKFTPATVNLLSNAGFCSATPPNCTATQSDLDIMGASLDMDFDQNHTFGQFTGAYFGLDSAISGFVQPVSQGDGYAIRATLGAPHFLADGTTPNVGSMQAFLPTSVLSDLFGLTPGEAASNGLEVSRTEASVTTDASYSVSAVAGGAVVEVDNITFSSPVYSISSADNNSEVQANDQYRIYGADGGVFNYGSARSFGSAAGLPLAKPIVGGKSASSVEGYYLVGADGGVFNYGEAKFHGSAGGLKLNKPVVGMDVTGNNDGYWLVASDGGVFAYGNAGFYGSAASLALNKPVVGIASTFTGEGYYEVASDGGIFAYGDAEFYGSAGSLPLNSPIVGMALSPTGNGYWLVAADGGVFAYGDAEFHGSMGGSKLPKPIVGITRSLNGGGYFLVSSDGGVYAFGDAAYLGGPNTFGVGNSIVGIG